LWSSIGAAPGLVLGTSLVAPVLSPNVVKLLFSSLWLCFGLLTLLKNREICSQNRIPAARAGTDAGVGIAIGLLGGVINSIIGVGIEMVLYTVLVLRYRCDLKAAVPTAVSVGAIASLMGIGLHAIIGDIGAEVFYNWLAAAPIVVLGAPFGALMVSVLPRVRTLYFVSVLCVLQFGWTLNQVSPAGDEWFFVGSSLLAANVAFYLLYRAGRLVRS
jgi:uncharacterized membrane protein YfcA